MVEARRERRKSNSRFPILDLQTEEHPLWLRVLYFMGAIGCILVALVGAVFPIIPAIPFWILAIVCMSHCFPAFGAFVRSLRIYQWLIAKLNEPSTGKRRHVVLAHRRKNQIMAASAVVLAILLCVDFFVLPLPRTWRYLISGVLSVGWAVLFAFVYLGIPEPEASIHPKRAARQALSVRRSQRDGSADSTAPGESGA